MMWSYYGAKTNIAHLYPPPKYGKIIEPFAGTARYALRYFDRDVLLVDKYDVIIKIWKWLQQCSPGDVLRLPRLKGGENINHYKFDCEEERLLMGFLIGFGFYSPWHSATVRLSHRPNQLNYSLNRIASNLFKIRHWEFQCRSYEEIENQEATWFIDPPYKHGGHAYVKSNRQIDFEQLSNWCRIREGQIIVCENDKAGWLDFQPLVIQNVRTGKHAEVFWTNEPTSYGVKQSSFIDQLI
jgi:site-specific DNA-adenine methylase